MKITAISMVRNRADVVRYSVLHHLSAGIDETIVLDNGSTDATPRILRWLQRVTGRVRFSRDEGSFRHSDAMTELARHAFRRGATWVVAFDADEFWWCRGGDLREVLGRTDAGMLEANVVNFIQRREQLAPSPGALLTMTRKVASPIKPRGRARELVEAERIAFVEMDYPPKFLARASKRMVIETGNHGVRGVPGPRAATDEIECLHAPLRSYVGLEAKMEHGRRVVESAAHRPDQGWHVRRWLDLGERGRLGDEWRANSYALDALDVYGERHPVVVDTRLRDAVLTLWGGARSWTRAVRLARPGRGRDRLGMLARRALHHGGIRAGAGD